MTEGDLKAESRGARRPQIKKARSSATGCSSAPTTTSKDGGNKTKGRGKTGRTSRRSRGDSRDLLLTAARAEFAARGLEGARVDEIARRAGVNKQLVYHHFGNKDDLYQRVLESVYFEIRQRERALDLSAFSPEQAMQRFVEFTFDYLDENRDFVVLLTDENLHEGRHLKDSQALQSLHSPLISVLDEVLKRGARDGTFRTGIDPRQIYMSIAALGFFYFNNLHTLSTIFGRDFGTRTAISERRQHVVDFVMNGLRR